MISSSETTTNSTQLEYDYEEKFVEALKKITSNSLKQKLIAIKKACR